MFSEKEIIQNTKQSFETLKYIFEVKFGDVIDSLSFSNMGYDVSTSDGLLDCNGTLNIEIGVPDPDLTVISQYLKNVDSVLNDVFRTYLLTPEGNLVKGPREQMMGIVHIVYQIKYNSAEENVSIEIGFILIDM
jgi:hypothetical protein